MSQELFNVLVAKYASNPLLFVKAVCNANPTPQQEEILRAIAEPGAKVSVKSGHGIGKSATLSWIALWFLICHKDSLIGCTAPSAHQLFDILWPEISRWRDKMNPIFKERVEISSDKIWIKGAEKTQYAVARTARKENPEALQGLHAPNMLFIIDEASGVDDKIFEVAEGAMSTQGAKVIMTSNPTRTDGYFYRSQTAERKYWTCLSYSCADSPLADLKWVNQMKERYGEDSPIYRVRVLGEFPESSDDILIPLSWIEESVDRDVEYTGAERVAGLDIARFGSDMTGLVIRKGNEVTYIDDWGKFDLMASTGKVFELYRDRRLFDRIHVDVIGLGAGVADRLKEMGVPVVDVNVAEAAAYSEKFNRLRDELWWKGREIFQDKLIKLPNPKDNPKVKKLIDELASVRYSYTSNGKIKIEGKDDMKKRGVDSPNLADALNLTYYEGGKVSSNRKARVFTSSNSFGGWI